MANSKYVRRMLEAGVSIGALCVVATPGAAQTTTSGSADQTTSQEAVSDAEIVVTGVRQALESAQARKKKADTVIDSISATDIGAFPDKSVADALQRVPGITVTRFAINTDTAHFTTEPSGVLVRGLPQVRNEFNGHDTFSANGGRALSWGDVPAELLAGVDIYKNQTAELIEGGIAGTVNLRTRLPFDQNGQLIQIGIKENYGDIAKKFTPDASGFYSNRWQTGIGEFGIMAHVAYSRVKTGSLGLQSYRAGIFEDGMIPGSEDVSSVFGDGTVVIPSSLSLLDDRFDRKRTGIAAAAQWKSNDDRWLVTSQYIRSNYNNSMEEHGVGVSLFGFPGGSTANFRFQPGASGIGVPAPGTPDFTFGSDGFMDSGTFAQTGGWWGDQNDAGMALNADGLPMIHSCYGWGGQPASYCPDGYDLHGPGAGTNSRIQKSRSMTQEASLNVKFDPTDNLHLSVDGQYVDSKTRFYDAAIGFGSFANPELSGLGTRPRILAFHPPSNIDQSPGGLTNPNNYYISNLADQIQNSKGHEFAVRADVEWNLPGDSWIDTLKFGARYSDREQLVRNSDYNWNNIANNWTNGCQYLYFNLDSQPGSCASGTTFNGYPADFYSVEQFGNPFFGGTVGEFPFMPFDFLNNHGLDLFARDRIGVGTFAPICEREGQAGTNGAAELPDSCFAPHEIADISEKTRALYVMAKFGGNDNISIGGVGISGNVGLRYVETTDASSGYHVYPQITLDTAALCPPTPLVPGGPTGNAPPPEPPEEGQPPRVAYSAVCWLSGEDVTFASGPGSATPVSSRNSFHHFLPSFNLRFDFSQDWLLRFAASKAMSRPDIGLLKNYLKVDQVLATSDPSDTLWVKDAQGNVIGMNPRYIGTATNPNLKPTTAWQFDLSLEHYFGRSGMFSLALFHKSFKNYIQSGSFFTEITNNGVTRTVQVTGPANGKGAKIQGFEVAYNTFFDFLPKPLNGFGIQTNFTYVKNKNVPNSNLQTFFPTAGGVGVPALNPGSLEGLSKYSYNVVGLYELPDFPVSFRLAYNWRSKYLITATDCCVGLPVWQKAAGYLDGSIRYSVNKNLELSVEGSNLLNTKSVTLQQLTDQDSPEGRRILMQNSWFRQDRRFTFGVRWKM
jgi:TonB-dependent receptor